MRLLSDSSAVAWCQALGHRIVGELPVLRVEYSRNPSHVRRLRTPDDSRAVVDLAFRLVMAQTPDDEKSSFPGGLLWLHRWEIGSEDIDRVGELLLAGMRGVAEGRADFHGSPAQLFDAGEFEAALSSLVVPILFAWDAYYVPADGSYILWISHEDYLDLLPRNADVDAHLVERTLPFASP